MARSNGIPFTIVYDPPLQEVGFAVRVLNYADFEVRKAEGGPGRPLAVLNRFVQVTMSTEIGGTGAAESGGLGRGSVTLDLDDAFWDGDLTDGSSATTVLEYEHVWQVWENGVLRFEFLGETVNRTFLTETQTRAVVVDGPGIGAVLNWGCVLPPKFPGVFSPSTAEGNFVFQKVPRMSAWLQVLATAVHRGTLGFVTPTFDHQRDSIGEVWEDLPVTVLDPATVTTLSADVNFASDSYTLTSAAVATITAMVAQFSAMSAPQVLCVGHTDSTNTIPYNQTLSENRANAVKNKIKELCPHALITSYGRGELQPIATNATSAGRAKNRRVTITHPSTTVVAPYDTPFSPTLGETMLDLLRKWTGENRDQVSPVRLEWMMRPGFFLDVRRTFGTDRSREVVFFEGSTHTISKTREQDRENIRNFIAVQDDNGDWSIAISQESVDRWRQREKYDSQPNATGATARGVVAHSELEMLRDERSTWTIKVPPYAQGRRVFVDYDLGDWIGVSRFRGALPSQVDRFRVMAITMQVGQDNRVDLELTLQNTVDAYAQRLKSRITSIINHMEDGTKTWISDAEPVTAKVGDLWTRSSGLT